MVTSTFGKDTAVVERSDGAGEPARPRRVMISYANEPDDPEHAVSVRHFWEFLRRCGIDAQLDLLAAQQRQDWSLWMADQIRDADYVLMIASPAYRDRAEGRGDGARRGVPWESRLIRNALYANQHELNRFIPVVLPGQSIDGIPDFLAPATSTVYHVTELTVTGAESLLRLLTDQPEIVEPPLGRIPELPPRPAPPAPHRRAGSTRRPNPTVHNVITGSVTGPVFQVGNIGSLSIGPSTDGNRFWHRGQLEPVDGADDEEADDV